MTGGQPQRIHSVHGIVPGVGVGLTGLLDQGVNREELPGPRIVVTPY